MKTARATRDFFGVHELVNHQRGVDGHRRPTRDSGGVTGALPTSRVERTSDRRGNGTMEGEPCDGERSGPPKHSLTSRNTTAKAVTSRLRSARATVEGETNPVKHGEAGKWKDAKPGDAAPVKPSNLLPAINPQGTGYIAWLVVVTLCYYYNACCIPLRESILRHQEVESWKYWMAADYFSDLIYLIDLVLVKPRLMFLEEGLWVTDTSLTSINYWTTPQYKLDYVSLLPLDIIYSYYGSKTSLLRLPRLLKFYTAHELYDAFDSLTSSGYTLRIGRSVFYIFFFIHLNACAFHKTDAVQKVNTNITTYLFYTYHATKTFITAGLYRPTPTFTFTIAVSCLSSLLIFAFLIGQIYEIFETATRGQREHRDRVDRCVQYLKKLNVPKPVICRVTDWFAYIWKQQHCFDESRILNFLPYNMKQDVAMAVHVSTLSKVDVFRGCSQALLRELVLKLQPVSFLPGDVVVRRGDVGHHMYIVKSGVCCVMSSDEREVLATLREGAVFGEISLLGIKGARRRTATVRSRGYSSLFALSKANLDQTLLYDREAALVLHRHADQIMRENAIRQVQNRMRNLENQKRLRRSQKKSKRILTIPQIKITMESSE